jgi:3-oxoacyl-[acyl-carrier protein] reductase
MDRLRERVAIVTGGAQGIGRAYCDGLAREGAAVIIADIDEDRAETAAKALRAEGAQALAVPTDVSNQAATERLARAAIDRFGRIDILINNAAIYQRPAMTHAPFEEIPVDEWDRLMGVNLRGVFLCARAVVPHMKQQRSGKIVNISSGTVMKGTPNVAHYVTSKAGVIGFTRVLARELGEYNICVNAVAPGYTASLEDLGDEEWEMLQRPIIQMRSIKRVQRPEDLVGTVVFLCLPESDFITGQTIVVDGGASML